MQHVQLQYVNLFVISIQHAISVPPFPRRVTTRTFCKACVSDEPLCYGVRTLLDQGNTDGNGDHYLVASAGHIAPGPGAICPALATMSGADQEVSIAQTTLKRVEVSRVCAGESVCDDV